MPKLCVMQTNGRLLETGHLIGGRAEYEFFRVMTERWGKLFFYSEEEYSRWCRNGRRLNEREVALKKDREAKKSAFEDGEGALDVELDDAEGGTMDTLQELNVQVG